MKRLIFATALCIGSAAVAQQPRPIVTTDHAAHGQPERERRLAMRERMGQLQLDMLVASIVGSDEQARNDTHATDQALASNAR